MRLHSTHERLAQVPYVLAGLLSRTRADENADMEAVTCIPRTGHTGKHQPSELKPTGLASERVVSKNLSSSVDTITPETHFTGCRPRYNSHCSEIKTRSFMIILYSFNVTKRKTKGASWAYSFIINPSFSVRGRKEIESACGREDYPLEPTQGFPPGLWTQHHPQRGRMCQMYLLGLTNTVFQDILPTCRVPSCRGQCHSQLPGASQASGSQTSQAKRRLVLRRIFGEWTQRIFSPSPAAIVTSNCTKHI